MPAESMTREAARPPDTRDHPTAKTSSTAPSTAPDFSRFGAEFANTSPEINSKLSVMKFQKCFCGFLLLTFAAIAYSQGTVIDDSLYSDALGETRMVDVYLPEGYYTDTTRYNVVYFLHGAGSSQNGYEFLIAILDSLIGYGIIEPVIVVKPDGIAGPFQNSMYANSELNGAVEDYIVVDLIGYIDSHYRTRASGGKRVIMGHSMGGVGTMKLGLKHPHLFRGWASHCCRINPEPDDFWISRVLTENGGSGPYDPNAGWFTRSAFTMAAAFSPNLDNPPYFVDFPLDNDGNWIDSTHAKWLSQYPACNPPLEPDVYHQAIYFDCGTEDELGNYPTNLSFADTLDARGIPYEFNSFVGNHNDQLPYRFPISLVFLDSAMRTELETGDREPFFPAPYLFCQNWPNPFNTSTTIRYSLPKASDIRITIHDILGRRMETLIEGRQHAGFHTVIFDAAGQASGIYFYRIEAGAFSIVKRCLLLK